MSDRQMFEEVYCSQCGGSFGPGYHGYSHCSDHTESALAAQQKSSDDIHTCSYYCTRPACIRAQRDELRDRLEAQQKADPVAFMFVTRDRKRGQRSEFAAIDWSCPIGEDIEVIDKRPLVYAAPHLDPEGIRLLREARTWLAECDLSDAIDAYLAKHPGEPRDITTQDQ